jgi:septal ring factor EnvC (AmiA/AmiB activator)
MGFLFTSAAWAGGRAAPPPGSAGAAPSHAADSKRLTRSQAEVERLERDLHKQESDNRQAGERLQQQDQKIAELRRQLQELQAGQAARQR